MALDADTLKDNIVARLNAVFGVSGDERDVDINTRNRAIQVIADAVVQHIKSEGRVSAASGQVTGTVTGNAPPGTAGGPIVGGTLVGGAFTEGRIT